MAEKGDLVVGAELKITNTRRNDPHVKSGRIVKVGRTLVHIDLSPEGVHWESITKFKIDTQHEQGDYSSYRFWLPGEYEIYVEHGGAVKALREQGVRLDRPSNFTVAQLRAIRAIVEEGEAGG